MINSPPSIELGTHIGHAWGWGLLPSPHTRETICWFVCENVFMRTTPVAPNCAANGLNVAVDIRGSISI